MNFTIVKNKFTGFFLEIRHRGELPPLRKLREAFRDSKAEDCNSITIARCNGVRVGIENGVVCHFE